MSKVKLLLSLTKPRIFLAIGLTAWLGFFLKEDFFSYRFIDSISLFFATVFASASGAVFNHYFERETDALMERTKTRPLVTADAATLRQALAFGFFLGLLGHGIAYFNFGWGSAFWLLMGWVNYVVFYTLIFKHNSQWNVTIGSFASAFSVLAGDTAFSGEVSMNGLILSALLFFWNPAHFWNLAAMYQTEYEAAEIPMMTSLVGRKKVVYLILLHWALVLACTLALWRFGTPTLGFLAGSITIGLVLFILNLQNLKVLSNKLFKRNFILSNIYLLVLYFTIVLDRLYPFTLS
ncbi:MAG: heme o synthase [SAR324 cluster bacterium]|nr:heme o synthase [SAR324 cluster bacterium]